MRKILVTAISGNVANGILKILQETEDEIYGCDINDYAVGMDKVKVFWKSDLAIEKEYIPNLLMQCEKYGITHIIPVNEKEIEIINSRRNEFELLNIKVLINSFDIVDTFLDKEKTVDKLLKIDGIHVPNTYSLENISFEKKKYIVKPKKSCGSKDMIIVSKADEFQKIAEKEKYIVQEYIETEDEEYTVGVFSDGEIIDTIIFKRKLENGYTSFVELVYDESINEDANRIAKSINLKGFINIQLRKRDNRNYIFEINPRISGTVYFRHLLEFKDVLWWLDLVDGIYTHTYKAKYTKAIGMRELREKYVIITEG